MRCTAAVVGAGALVALSCGAHSSVRWLAGGARLVPVTAPDAESGDTVESLVDQRVGPSDWYCAEADGVQRFEVTFADGALHPVRAVGFVPGVVGPDGVGEVRVRVQYGSGEHTHGEEFRASVRGRSQQVEVVRLPFIARGDHVALSFATESPYATARCLGELLVYEDAESYAAEGGDVTRAEPVRADAAPAQPAEPAVTPQDLPATRESASPPPAATTAGTAPPPPLVDSDAGALGGDA